MRSSLLTSFCFTSAIALFMAGCGGGSEAGDAALGGSVVGSGTTTDTPPEPGILTAGDWDDNLNFALFQNYLTDHAKSANSASFNSGDRIVITVTNAEGQPVSNAYVQIVDATYKYLSAPTASDGRVLFFPHEDGMIQRGPVTILVAPPPGQQAATPVSVPLPKMGADITIKLPDTKLAPPKELDLAFVIDTTGSMGDEINYLKAEIQGIVDGVKTKFSGVSIHYSVILYRDHGDDYVTRVFDFTSDLGNFKGQLAAQSAGGGGDMPEAMDEAMAKVPDLAWRTGNTARMAFLIADAPPHPGDDAATLSAMNALRPLGVKLYPVAASGVDAEAEYVMRVGAEATLGRYLFLTDDSGVGAPHEEPHIPCYQVQKLNTLIGRMIASELSGTRVPADPGTIIRSVGDPHEGVCRLMDGSEAHL